MSYYGRPKKGKMDWLIGIFVALCVLTLVGALAFCFIVSKDGGAGFRNLMGGGNDSSSRLSK